MVDTVPTTTLMQLLLTICASFASASLLQSSLTRSVIIHRHGDRSPLHSLTSSTSPDAKWLSKTKFDSEEAFWFDSLPKRELDTKVMAKVTFSGKDQQEHWANGVPPYGRLSLLGFLQLINVGSEIQSNLSILVGRPLSKSDVLFSSTNFDRTKRSAVGFSIGFFGDDNDDSELIIDNLSADIFVPDRDGDKGPLTEHHAAGSPDVDVLALRKRLSRFVREKIFLESSEPDNEASCPEPFHPMRLFDLFVVSKERKLLSSSVPENPDVATLESVCARGWGEWVRTGSGRKMIGRAGWEEVIDWLTEPKNPILKMVSAHDSTILSLVHLFGSLEYLENRPKKLSDTIPPYASYLQINLFEGNLIQFKFMQHVVVPLFGCPHDEQGFVHLEDLLKIKQTFV